MTSIIGWKPEHYAKLNLTPGEIAQWEDGLRTDPADTSFEWWYFDCALEDGGKLTVEFHTKPPTGSPREPLTPFVGMTLDRADGTNATRAYTGKPDDFSASSERCDVRIGPNTFAGDLRRYEIHLEIDDVIADIVLDAEVPSWRPATGHVFVDDDHYIAWLPSVPCGRVSGSLSIDGNPELLDGGAGYHDHNWGNIALRRAIDHWYWGRARIGDYTVITLNFISHEDHGKNVHPAFLVAKDGQILAAGEHDVEFSATDFRNHPDTGVPVANRLVYRYLRDDTGYVVEFNRKQDVFQLDFRKAGAYHRFTGGVTLQHRVGGELVETAESDALWELLWFGNRAQAGAPGRHEQPTALVHQA
jgi:hypothetical protein